MATIRWHPQEDRAAYMASNHARFTASVRSLTPLPHMQLRWVDSLHLLRPIKSSMINFPWSREGLAPGSQCKVRLPNIARRWPDS